MKQADCSGAGAMYDDQFRWGPLARGAYIAMLWLTILVGWHYSHLLGWYVALLIFLGLVLRPLLIATGLAQYLADVRESMLESHWEKRNERRRMEITRSERDKQYRYRRTKDPRLPRNW